MLVKIASAAAITVLIMMSILTPERDKFGNYTHPVQYWTDSAYFKANF